MLIVVCGDGQAVYIHQVNVGATHNGGHTLHLLVGLENNVRITRVSQCPFKQRMLCHQLGDRQIPVQLIGNQLPVTERLFQALLLHLPVSDPASKQPGHNQCGNENKNSTDPVGHSIRFLNNRGKPLEYRQAEARTTVPWLTGYGCSVTDTHSHASLHDTCRGKASFPLFLDDEGQNRQGNTGKVCPEPALDHQ